MVIFNPSPFYKLSEIKNRLGRGDFKLNPDATGDALFYFGWDKDDVAKCLRKLNDRYHDHDPQRNHFLKSVKHDRFPHILMDYYQAIKIMEDQDVYTHFYIRPDNGLLVISSFHNLIHNIT